jgi:hypothetical protein
MHGWELASTQQRPRSTRARTTHRPRSIAAANIQLYTNNRTQQVGLKSIKRVQCFINRHATTQHVVAALAACNICLAGLAACLLTVARGEKGNVPQAPQQQTRPKTQQCKHTLHAVKAASSRDEPQHVHSSFSNNNKYAIMQGILHHAHSPTTSTAAS